MALALRTVAGDPEGADSRAIWQWRNDPVTRAMSRNTAEVPWPDHVRWFAAAVVDPRRTLLMVMRGADTVGVVRFDALGPGEAEININLDPALRGQGLGKQALEAACAHGLGGMGLGRIYAEVRPENLASVRIFEGVGFLFAGERDGLRTYWKTRGQAG